MKLFTAARVLVVVGLVLVASHVGAQNLLTNPSFDSDFYGWDASDSDIEAVFRSDVGSTLAGGSGSGSIEIRLSYWNGSSSGIVQEVTAVQGTEYELGFSAYLPAADNPANNASVFAWWHDIDGLYIEMSTINPSVWVHDQWMRIEGTVTAPAGAVTVRVVPAVSNPADSSETRPGILVIDDVWFAAVDATATVQEVFYPAGASVAGLAGTFWTTDGWFRSTSGAEVQLFGAFLRQGADNTAAVMSPVSLGVVPANGSLVIEDIISDLGGNDSAGGVYVRAEAIGGTQLPFIFATSYTSTPNPEAGGSYGQGIPAVGRGEKGITVSPAAFQNSERRTNAGVLNTSQHAIAVRVVVVDRDGATAGEQTWNLAPYSQKQVSLRNLGVSNLNGGSVVFDLLSTIGSYRAYTSTVDAITGDAVYTEAR